MPRNNVSCTRTVEYVVVLVDTLFGGGRPRGTAIGFDHGRVQRPGWDLIPRSPSDRPIVFRDFWPGFPPDYSTYRQMLWATLIANMAAGRPDDDLGVMTSNLSGCWCFSLLPGAADKTIPPLLRQCRQCARTGRRIGPSRVRGKGGPVGSQGHSRDQPGHGSDQARRDPRRVATRSESAAPVALLGRQRLDCARRRRWRVLDRPLHRKLRGVQVSERPRTSLGALLPDHDDEVGAGLVSG